ELSVSSDEKMKNIVATIQRDQNKIIRNQSAQTLIIQGVAGSGKTSIALHRIAFLLYKYKTSLNSDDILIISPNKVFSDYISNVLPELGEDLIPQTGMEEIAAHILGDTFKFQTHANQINCLLEKNDKKLISRLKIKSISDFIEEIDGFLSYFEKNYFNPQDLQIDDIIISRSVILNKFQSYHRIPVLNRYTEVAQSLSDYVKIKFKKELKKSQIKKIETGLKKMFKTINLKQIYKDFFVWLEMPEYLKMLPKSVYEFSDVFPLVYIKIKLEGVKINSKVKHLLIDEMQDYSPIQYTVLSMLFPCPKTILGDVYQSVNPYSLTNAYHIKKVFDDATIMKLNKSYRSTFEITEFAQKINPNKELEPIERHGEIPKIKKCENFNDEVIQIEKLIAEFKKSDYNSMGIICKTPKQAEELFERIQKFDAKAYLLNYQSSVFYKGVVITSAYMAKGLEFDEVVIPFVNIENYNRNIDKSTLYVACTRAMHKLNLTFFGEKTEFLIF
ncbi:MAG: AAA family ATPase, partial [Bacteroidales bacterium]|nr:AAA family ATPase [Bacteroidales bacterium]